VLRVEARRGDVLVPAHYGEYDAKRAVGLGGSGVVLTGRRRRDGRPVAIKVLLPRDVDLRDGGAFRREVAALARVRDPNVVRLLAHGRSGRLDFLVTEWVDGPSLAGLIAGYARAGMHAEFAEARRWLAQAARGLTAIHAAGLVHRDVKPANILIGADGRAKVVDLGIARGLDAAETDLTATGLIPGTFAYMAPELLTSPGSVDARADLFALGVTFYQLLTGGLPSGSWRPASDINPTVPVRFDAILARLLRPRPEDRYPDADALLEDCSTPRMPGPAAASRGCEPMRRGAVAVDPPDRPTSAGALTDPLGPGRGIPGVRPARRVGAAAIAARDFIAASLVSAASMWGPRKAGASRTPSLIRARGASRVRTAGRPWTRPVAGLAADALPPPGATRRWGRR
jgi:serine/threonine protein kinase